MAKKISKDISVSKIDSIYKEGFCNTVTAEWHGVEVSITKTISLSDMLSFVSDVVAKCFDENGDYFPELMDFAIKENILTRFANFRMPSNVDHQYNILYQTDAVDFVCMHINENQLNDIIDSIEAKLDYIKDSNIMFIRAKINKLIEAMESLQENALGLFSGITKEDINAVVGSFAEGGKFNEEKLVKAYANIMHNRDGNQEMVDE